jgi:hypothetical protein
MAFSTRRGRPRKDPVIEKNDLGTPELRQKRQLSLTTEAIDLLLQKDIITHDQHWCALHFRWLYTLRYGAPSVQSLDPARVNGIMHLRIYTEWQEEREDEWKRALEVLNRYHCLRAVSDCAIYNDYHPRFHSLISLGLEQLRDLWCRQNITY